MRLSATLGRCRSAASWRRRRGTCGGRDLISRRFGNILNYSGGCGILRNTRGVAGCANIGNGAEGAARGRLPSRKTPSRRNLTARTCHGHLARDSAPAGETAIRMGKMPMARNRHGQDAHGTKSAWARCPWHEIGMGKMPMARGELHERENLRGIIRESQESLSGRC